MSALHEAIEGCNTTQINWLLEQGVDVNDTDAAGNTPLMLAVRKGTSAWHVHPLMEHGADVHARDRMGRTPLMLALDYGSHSSVRTLLEHYTSTPQQPEVNSDYEQGRLALLFAIYNNDVTTLSALLDAGADPNARNQQGRTPLMMAVELDHADAAACLLKRGADVHARETEGNCWTPLHFAADCTQTDGTCAHLLLEQSAEVDARDRGQWTPLIWAAFSSSVSVVRLLLEHGADVHAENEEGTSALSQAGWLGNADTIRTLLEWGAGNNTKHLKDAFHAAFTDNNQDKVALFIEAGVKIGLSEAVLLEDIPCIKPLLTEGVEADELNNVLITAAGHAPVQIVRLLLAYGADPNARSGDQTALMQTYWNFNYTFANIEALLKAGADVNARDEHGKTPFTMRTGWSMSEKGRLELMQKMLPYGVDVNVQNAEGVTALMDAARVGETQIARFLLEHGAEINLRDKEGRTSLMFAAAAGETEMVRLLLEHGANVTERAVDDSTAFTLAKRWVGKEAADILLEEGAVE